MISKVSRGSRMSGLVRYLFGPGRSDEHINQRIVACSDGTWVGTRQPNPSQLQQLIAELDDPKVRHGDATKAGYVYHVPISIDASEHLDDQQWREVAETFVAKMQLGEDVNWVAVHHGASAKGNDHIHLVVNLIRDDGRPVNLWRDFMRQAEARAELEQQFGLSATSAPGHGDGSLSRVEIERVRSGSVDVVEDLGRHRLAATVRAVATGARSETEFVERLRGEGLVVHARVSKYDPSNVTGYRVAERTETGRGALVWYGGGTLGKDLRLPALRSRWAEAGAEPVTAAVWGSSHAQRPLAVAEHVAAASDALSAATRLVESMPTDDRAGWLRARSDAAGLLAAAAAATPNPALRRELTRGWQAVNRALPGRAQSGRQGVNEPRIEGRGEPAAREVDADDGTSAWPDPIRFARPHSDNGQALATLLGGASRVLMASRVADAPAGLRLAALVAQAVQLAAQISRTVAAHVDAQAAEHRAAAACAAAAEVATGQRRGLWNLPTSGGTWAQDNGAGGETHNSVPAPAINLDPDLGRG